MESAVPTASPTGAITSVPTPSPASFPTTRSPTISPTTGPLLDPITRPTPRPSLASTPAPSLRPTRPPTAFPTPLPSLPPTALSSILPTVPTPDFAQVCATNADYANMCLAEEYISHNRRQLCFDCIQQAFDNATLFTGCDDLNSALCPAFLRCEDVCGDCLTYMDAVNDCRSETCPTDCMADDAPGPPELTCTSQRAVYEECMDNLYDGLLDRETCYDCVKAAFEFASRASCIALMPSFAHNSFNVRNVELV